MTVIPMFATSLNHGKQNIALINGKEVPYNGLTSPDVSYDQALKFYSPSRYEYLGAGYMVADITPQVRHFFTKKAA